MNIKMDWFFEGITLGVGEEIGQRGSKSPLLFIVSPSLLLVNKKKCCIVLFVASKTLHSTQYFQDVKC